MNRPGLIFAVYRKTLHRFCRCCPPDIVAIVSTIGICLIDYSAKVSALQTQLTNWRRRRRFFSIAFSSSPTTLEAWTGAAHSKRNASH